MPLAQLELTKVDMSQITQETLLPDEGEWGLTDTGTSVADDTFTLLPWTVGAVHMKNMQREK